MERTASFEFRVNKKQRSTKDLQDERTVWEKIRNNSVRRGDADLHLSVRIGNRELVKNVLSHFQSKGSKDSIWKKNSVGETALFIAAENGHVEILHEILKVADRQSVPLNIDNSTDAFHIAAKLGYAEVVKELLHAVPGLTKTTNSSDSTALYTASAYGHKDVVQLLLHADDSIASIARSNGRTALHIASKMGHLETVNLLLRNDPLLSLRTDRKGQTALHMAAKGEDPLIVREFLNYVPSVIHIVDNKGNSPLHTATRKGCPQIVSILLSFRGINVSTLNKAGETALNIAEKYFNEEIASILRDATSDRTKKEIFDCSPLRSPKQLKQAVSFIRQGFQFQLKRSKGKQLRVQELKRKADKMKFLGLNNAVNSVNVVATLIASVAFAAIFQIPGQYAAPGNDIGYVDGEAYISTGAPFVIFLISDSIALFVSLAVVMVQTSLVVIDPKALKTMVFVINKLMWACCISISVSYISLSYVVIGNNNCWLAWSTLFVAVVILLGTLGIMFYCGITYRIQRKIIKNRIRKAVSGAGESYARCRSLVTESLLKVECKKKMYAI